MQKINFSYLLLKNKDRIIGRNKHPMPDFPKKIVYTKPQILYIKANILNFQIEELQLDQFYEALKDLGQPRTDFPFAVFKSANKNVLCSGFDETAELCQEHFILNERFEVTEYIISSSDSVQIIRIFISGQNMTAKILQNQSRYDSSGSKDQRFKLNFFQSSSNMILSASTTSLKQKATSLYYWISGSFDKGTIMTRLALDFIKNGEKYYFIEAHSCKLEKSVNAKKKVPSGISPTLTSPHNSSRELLSMRTLRINRIEQKKKEKITEKEESKDIIELRKLSIDTGVIQRGYTLGSRGKEDGRKGLNFELKGLVNSLDEAVRKMEKEKLASPQMRTEYEEFLQSKTISIRSESDKIISFPSLFKEKSRTSCNVGSSRISLRLSKN